MWRAQLVSVGSDPTPRQWKSLNVESKSDAIQCALDLLPWPDDTNKADLLLVAPAMDNWPNGEPQRCFALTLIKQPPPRS